MTRRLYNIKRKNRVQNIILPDQPDPTPDPAPSFLKSLSGLMEWVDAKYAASVSESGGIIEITGLSEYNTHMTSVDPDNTPDYSNEEFTFDNVDDFIRINHPKHLSSNQLPDIPTGPVGHGFTCTGLCYDAVLDCFWVGDDGREDTGDSNYQPTIVQLSKDLTTVLSVIEVYNLIGSATSIQGVTIDTSDNTIWACMVLSNKIYQFSKAGALLSGEITTGSGHANGLAYDPTLDEFWTCTDNNIYRYDKSSVLNQTISQATLGVVPLDHLFLDDDSRLLYGTYQISGVEGAGVLVYDLGLSRLFSRPTYLLPEAGAVEGITIADNNLYIANDAYFHSAPSNKNEIIKYSLSATLAQLGKPASLMWMGLIKCPTSAGLDGIWANGRYSGQSINIAAVTNDTTLRVYVVTNNISTQDFTVSSMSVYSIVGIVWDITNRTLQCWQNGVQVGTTRSLAAISGTYQVLSGEFGNLGNESTPGPAVIKEYACYINNITSIDREKLEGWLAWNNDMVDLIPIGHPYKLSSPEA